MRLLILIALISASFAQAADYSPEIKAELERQQKLRAFRSCAYGGTVEEGVGIAAAVSAVGMAASFSTFGVFGFEDSPGLIDMGFTERRNTLIGYGITLGVLGSVSGTAFAVNALRSNLAGPVLKELAHSIEPINVVDSELAENKLQAIDDYYRVLNREARMDVLRQIDFKSYQDLKGKKRYQKRMEKKALRLSRFKATNKLISLLKEKEGISYTVDELKDLFFKNALTLCDGTLKDREVKTRTNAEAKYLVCNDVKECELLPFHSIYGARFLPTNKQLVQYLVDQK